MSGTLTSRHECLFLQQQGHTVGCELAASLFDCSFDLLPSSSSCAEDVVVPGEYSLLLSISFCSISYGVVSSCSASIPSHPRRSLLCIRLHPDLSSALLSLSVLILSISMSHPAEEAPPLVPLRFATLEELEEWLQCVVPQEPDLRLSTWRVVAASSVRVLDVLLRHAGQLPALRELLIAPRRFESQEGGEPDAPHPARRQATATAESDTVTDESLPRDNVGSRQPSTTDTAVSHSSAPQIELETELDTTLETGAVTTSVSMASVSSILTALDGAVAAVYCGAAPGVQPGGGEGTAPHHKDDARGGRSVDVWPMLEIVRGHLADIVQLCELHKRCIHEVLVWLDTRSLAEAVYRKQLKHVLLALDPETLTIETREEEWRDLLSVLVSTTLWTVSP